MESSKAQRCALFRRVTWCALLVCAWASAADPPPLAPVTVCEVLADLPAHEGKDFAVLGRYSFRRDGRWIGQDGCGASASILVLNEDSAAPKPPGNFDLDGAVLARKFAELVKHTALGKFRFGTPEYDRWAVIFGRVETRKSDDARKIAAELDFRGSGVVVFLTTEK
ncbi:MAG TPA: hypothetical protein VMH28_10640 [Candidatus Acidoferrales bacterium]|nr:hypothetical protein [Bryobacteraceae bacterium]HTS62476.1 hypothetical protein [Candidatus Acidoferrales bacterium]